MYIVGVVWTVSLLVNTGPVGKPEHWVSVDFLINITTAAIQGKPCMHFSKHFCWNH